VSLGVGSWREDYLVLRGRLCLLSSSAVEGDVEYAASLLQQTLLAFLLLPSGIDFAPSKLPARLRKLVDLLGEVTHVLVEGLVCSARKECSFAD
jgi:hypothetical protein